MIPPRYRPHIMLTALVFGLIITSYSIVTNPRPARPIAQQLPLHIESGANYPQSTYITSFVWETKSVKKGCGDNVPVTWAQDNNLYSELGECTGFSNTDGGNKSLNIVKISDTGDPYAFTGSDMQSLFKQPGSSTYDVEDGWGNLGSKTSGMLAVDGVLYVLNRNADGTNRNRSGTRARLAYSTDNGNHFDYVDWLFDLGYPVFLNFGKNYEGARDNFVYIYSPNTNSAYSAASGGMVLLRVPREQIKIQSAYEYFQKLDNSGAPVWTKDTQSKGIVFSCATTSCSRAQVSYNPYVKRYFYWQQIYSDGNGRVDTRFSGGVGVYEAPEPWGPWKTVFFTKNWNQTVGATDPKEGPGEGGSFPGKWISSDGKTMFLAYSGNNGFAVRKVTLSIDGTVQPTNTPAATSITPSQSCTLKSTGDANCDGLIDIADFEQFRKEFTGAVTTTLADFNNDHTVSISDFEVWRRAYYSPSPSVTVATTATPAPGMATGYTVTGNKIYKADGTTHIFRGINRPSFEWNSKGENISLADFERMKSWGSNVVRLPMNQKFWRDNTNGYKTTIAQNIQLIKSLGMDIILDLHWSDKGILTGVAAQQRMPDTNSVEFWKQVATVYKDDPAVLFELYNEPHDVSWEVWLNGGDSGDGFTAVGMQQLYNAVRSTGAKNIVVIGGLNWAFDLSGVSTHSVSGTNIVFATHPYNFAGKNTVSDWDKCFGNLAKNYPIIMTEFGDTKAGTFGDRDCDASFIQNLLNYTKGKGISWTGWAWYPGGCTFPPIIKDWNGTPNSAGALLKQRITEY